jgi:hypothetical protein
MSVSHVVNPGHKLLVLTHFFKYLQPLQSLSCKQNQLQADADAIKTATVARTKEIRIVCEV